MWFYSTLKFFQNKLPIPQPNSGLSNNSVNIKMNFLSVLWEWQKKGQENPTLHMP